MTSSSSSSAHYGGTSDWRRPMALSAASSSYRSAAALPLPGDSAAPYIAEFVGTFVLVFGIGCIVIAPGSPTWFAVAVGCMLMSLVYATAPVSGGNLNPAVSLSLGLIGELKWVVVVRYWIAQFSAGILASFCVRALFAPDRPTSVAPVAPFTWEYAVTAEVMYTFLWCFVFNNVWASKRNNPKDDPNQFFALAIGFVIIAGAYSCSKISGASFNPAISIGLSCAGDRFRSGFAWLFAEMIGASLGAIMFRAVRPEEYNPPDGGMDLASYSPKLHARCASEFIGTFMVVLTFGLNLTMGSPAAAFSYAAALMCMMYSLYNVSGAHLNPAVTLAVVLSGRDKCSPTDGVAYVVSQVLGGACGGFLYAQYHDAGPSSGLTYSLEHGDGFGPGAAGVIELFFTCILAFAYLACATTATPRSSRTTQAFIPALVVGACVIAGGFSAGVVSGGELNPAISVGVASANLAHHGRRPPPPFTSCLVYSLWQLTGGLLAAVVFGLTHPAEYKKAPLLAK